MRQRHRAGSSPGRHPLAATGRRAGFSLLEVLIAMLILTVGATSLIALFASASTTHKRAVDRTHAALVAEEILSEVRARYGPDTEPRDIIEDLRASLPSQMNGYFWEIVLYRPGETPARARFRRADEDDRDPEWMENELLVRIAVRWARSAQAREEVYTTLILPRAVPGS